MINPFRDGSNLHYEVVSQHLDNYGPFFFDSKKQILRKYNGSYWQVYETSRLEKKLRDVLGDYVSEKGIKNCISKFLSRVMSFRKIDPNQRKMINFINGSYCLEKEKLLDHRKEDYFFNRLDIVFNEKDKCPRWELFLEEICLGDQDLISIIQEMFGYCLVPGNNYQVAFILFGTGENGKSVLLEILRNVLGVRNTCSVSLGELSNRFSTIQLVDKLANICDESPTGKAIESEMFKNITGGGFITVEQKYKDSYMIACTAKQIFATNSTLWIKDHTHALFRRLMIVPFGYKVPKEKRDNNLKESLMDELGGIINWAIEGYQRLLRNDSFTHCKYADEAKKEFIRDMDSVKTFLDEHCVIGVSFSIPCLELYEAYKQFSDENGYKACSHGEFGKRIRSYYSQISKERESLGPKGYRYYGVSIMPL